MPDRVTTDATLGRDLQDSVLLVHMRELMETVRVLAEDQRRLIDAQGHILEAVQDTLQYVSRIVALVEEP